MSLPHPTSLSDDRLAVLQQFDSLAMSELMDRAELMDRSDRKFVFHRDLLSAILLDCVADYHILEMGGHRYFDYDTEYYDTPDWQFYLQHHRGKANRYKVRRRTYGSTGEEFIELKHKTHKGNTQKIRVMGHSLESAQSLLLEHLGGDIVQQLRASLCVQYQRITLLHKSKNEKVTLDFSLRWSAPAEASPETEWTASNPQTFENIVIAEVKSTNLHFNTFQQIAKNRGIREGSLSKYCMGCLTIYPTIKHNRFKQTYQHILKLEHA